MGMDEDMDPFKPYRFYPCRYCRKSRITDRGIFDAVESRIYRV